MCFDQAVRNDDEQDQRDHRSDDDQRQDDQPHGRHQADLASVCSSRPSRTGMLKGLVRCSEAPRLRARNTSASLDLAVSMMTCVCCKTFFSRKAWSTPKPSRLGNPTSRRTIFALTEPSPSAVAAAAP